jgi:hypothetical protein
MSQQLTYNGPVPSWIQSVNVTNTAGRHVNGENWNLSALETLKWKVGNKEFTWREDGSLPNHLDLIAIAQKLEKMDTPSRSEALDRDYSALQQQMKLADSQIRSNVKQIDDLLSAADVQGKVGSEGKDILAAMNRLEERMLAMECEQTMLNKKIDGMCCIVM